MKVSVVIPCYHSPDALESLVEDLVRGFSLLDDAFEVILVVDSRESRTLTLTRRLSDQFDQVRRLVLSKNSGQQAATAAGIIHSTGEIVVTLDDDYQHTPEDAIRLVQQLKEEPGVDLVYGVPRQSHQSLLRRISGSLFRSTMKASGIPFFHLFGPLRAFRGHFRQVISGVAGPSVAIDVALGWAVDDVRGVPCDFKHRSDGATGYSGLQRLKLAVSFLVAQSTVALRWGIYLGLLGVVISAVLAARILFLYLTDALFVPGFATTVLAILFVGSVQLFVLGVLGHYLGLLHQRTLGQPAFHIIEGGSD